MDPRPEPVSYIHMMTWMMRYRYMQKILNGCKFVGENRSFNTCFALKQLGYLDLSDNDIWAMQIPSFLG